MPTMARIAAVVLAASNQPCPSTWVSHAVQPTGWRLNSQANHRNRAPPATTTAAVPIPPSVVCSYPTSRDHGFGIPGVNAPGIPGVICSGPGAGGGGAGAGIGRPGISGASVGCPPGGIPSVGKTGSLQKPSGVMWSLQKFVEFITTMYSLHSPGGLGAGAIAPSGQRQVQLRAPTPAPPNAKLPPLLVAWPIIPLTPKPPASQCICEPLISVG